MRKNKELLLSDVRDGETVVVINTGSDEIMVQTLRFGLDTGSIICVEKNISGGPVIVSRNQLEIAIGREIAKNILVAPLAD